MRPTVLFAIAATSCALVQAEPVTITSAVVDEAQTPIQNAEVWVWPSDEGPGIMASAPEDGSFRLELGREDHTSFQVIGVAPGLLLGASGTLSRERGSLL